MRNMDCDGAEIWYEVVGAGDVLITLHGGLGLDSSYFRPWLDPLGESRAVVFFDQRANGRSSGTAEQLTMQRLADDADALRAVLGAERVSLLGHSYGGFVALQYALSCPERVAALVLCDTDATAPTAEVIGRELQRLGAGPDVMETMGSEVTSTEDMRKWFAVMGRYYMPHSDPASMQAALGEVRFSKAGDEGGGRALAGWDVTSRLGEIAAPTLVVTGRDDFMFPPDRAQVIADAIPGAQLLVYDHSGHLPFIERHDAFLADVGGFLDRIA